jgi:hypothetical protein
MSAENPLTLVVEEYERASAVRDSQLLALKARIGEVEAEFLSAMSAVVKVAHKQGVSRYMVQKATKLAQPEVAAWFGGLPNAKPGRRRKDDPVYAGLREMLPESASVVENVTGDSNGGVLAGWVFGKQRYNGVECSIPVTSPEGVAYTVLLSERGDVAWLDADGNELSLDDRLAKIPDDVEAYVREGVWP